MEIAFLSYDVRFIAINDSVDSASAVNEMSGIRNYFNDFYAADTSKKNRAASESVRSSRMATLRIPNIRATKSKPLLSFVIS